MAECRRTLLHSDITLTLGAGNNTKENCTKSILHKLRSLTADDEARIIVPAEVLRGCGYGIWVTGDDGLRDA
jgi:hypothetical protein